MDLLNEKSTPSTPFPSPFLNPYQKGEMHSRALIQDMRKENKKANQRGEIRLQKEEEGGILVVEEFLDLA